MNVVRLTHTDTTSPSAPILQVTEYPFADVLMVEWGIPSPTTTAHAVSLSSHAYTALISTESITNHPIPASPSGIQFVIDEHYDASTMGATETISRPLMYAANSADNFNTIYHIERYATSDAYDSFANL